MAITCHVRIGDERDTRQLTFEATPRVGEFISFSRDDQPDHSGVLHGETFKVKYVIHIAGSDKIGPQTTLEVVELDNVQRS